MKHFLLLLTLLLSFNLTAQDFYQLNEIQLIEITFTQANWDQILDTEYNTTGEYTMAENVTINGISYDSVGVKYKGNSTYNANQTKNPFHIELDTYKEHDYQGYKDIKLSNVAKDPSFLREVLSYQILRKYMKAPQSNFANVYVNGNLMGLYSNSEAITKTFVKDRFGSKGNTFLKCNPIAGAGPGSSETPNLEYLGENITSYDQAYELKSDAGWEELIDLCDTLANELGAIENILDVDKALWMLAFDNVLVNLDSYIGRFIQNYYLYRDDYGRFASVVWDLNESFGQFSDAGSGAPLNNTTAKQQMNHLLHTGEENFPLVSQLLSVPVYKRMYLAHVKTILKENFENDEYYTIASSLHSLIDESVAADNNKFFTYANFQDNIDSDINGGGGPGGGATPGIANLMDGRQQYLLAQNDFTVTEPTFNSIVVSNIEPQIDETITITASIDNTTDVYLGYRTDVFAPFQKLTMYDDGMHNDGTSNDGVFGTDLTIEAVLTQYYIYADNPDIGKFSPDRAEHEYYEINASNFNPNIGALVINEFMASNNLTQADQDGEFDDWIEFYNNGSESISLDNYTLSDDAEELNKWTFPLGTTIEPNSYLIVWADNDVDQEGLHTNFKLSASSEALFLSNDEGTVLDEVNFYDQESDISYGRFPNGTGSFQTMSATFNAENMTVSSTYLTGAHDISIYPNPATNLVNFSFGENIPNLINIYNIDGKLVRTTRVNSEFHKLDVQSLNGGFYLAQIVFDNKIITKKIALNK